MDRKPAGDPLSSNGGFRAPLALSSDKKQGKGEERPQSKLSKAVNVPSSQEAKAQTSRPATPKGRIVGPQYYRPQEANEAIVPLGLSDARASSSDEEERVREKRSQAVKAGESTIYLSDSDESGNGRGDRELKSPSTSSLPTSATLGSLSRTASGRPSGLVSAKKGTSKLGLLIKSFSSKREERGGVVTPTPLAPEPPLPVSVKSHTSPTETPTVPSPKDWDLNSSTRATRALPLAPGSGSRSGSPLHPSADLAPSHSFSHIKGTIFKMENQDGTRMNQVAPSPPQSPHSRSCNSWTQPARPVKTETPANRAMLNEDMTVDDLEAQEEAGTKKDGSPVMVVSPDGNSLVPTSFSPAPPAWSSSSFSNPRAGSRLYSSPASYSDPKTVSMPLEGSGLPVRVTEAELRRL